MIVPSTPAFLSSPPSSTVLPSLRSMSTQVQDIEAQKYDDEKLVLEWEDISYTIKDKRILHGVSGSVAAGEMLAVMGPSGAGKSTILDVLAKRSKTSGGTVTVNGDEAADMSTLAAYVEQDDALLGVLTVRETLEYAARLSLPSDLPSSSIHDRIDKTLAELGLSDVSHHRIGNAIQRGISGGQKRRVTLGAALVTMPRILILDEPTSGLDSRAGWEVMRAVKNIATRHGMIVIASIHQPNWETFALFDKLLLLAQGRTMFFGPTDELSPYLTTHLSHPIPIHANPTDHALDVVSTDFIQDPARRERHVEELAERWGDYVKGHLKEEMRSTATRTWFLKGAEEKEEEAETETEVNRSRTGSEVDASSNGHMLNSSEKKHARTQRPFGRLSVSKAKTTLYASGSGSGAGAGAGSGVRRALRQTGILMERNMINYSRNLLAYGVRLGMYLGMGVLLATVWVNLAQTSVKINDRLSVHFFSVAFLGFMSVAGIPAFLEERHVFVRERMNGLYGPGAYVLANSLCTVPYLFVCSVVFCVLCYWSIGLHPGATQFFRFLGILFLAVYTAESQSAVIAAILPIFVAALAVASFLNGFWMCVGGYFIKAVNLPRFWYYWAHFIDYQTYAFDLLVVNDFRGLVFDCATEADGSCHCDYPSSLVAQGECKLRGDDVLNALDIGGINSGLYAGILLCIALVFRVMLYAVLVLKKR